MNTARKRMVSLALALCLLVGMAGMVRGEGAQDPEQAGETSSQDGSGRNTWAPAATGPGAATPTSLATPTRLGSPVGAPMMAVVIQLNGLTGSSAGTGWAVNGNVVELNGPGPFLLTGSTSAYGVRANHSSVAVTFSGARIDGTTPVVAAFDCNGNDVAVTLAGASTLKGGQGAGLLCELGASVTIGGGGSLTATAGGSVMGAGIGSGAVEDCGTVTVNGGTVIAVGKDGAAGIGSGGTGSGGNVTVNGGAVTASSGSGLIHGTAFGSFSGAAGSLTIRGGTVTAIGGTQVRYVDSTVLFSGEATLHTSGRADSIDVTTDLGSVQWAVTGGASITSGTATDPNITVDVPATPATIALKVLPPSDATLQSVAGQPVHVTGGAGTDGYPYAAAIALDSTVNSVSSRGLATVNPAATAEVYADDSFGAVQSSVPLEAGDNDLYIKVTSQDRTAERYYHVIATRKAGQGGSGGTSGSGGGDNGDSDGRAYTTPVKTQIPDSALSWDGDRTLTINYDGITALGLTGVKWDGVKTTAYTVHSGSVIVRFDRDFIASQSSGEHRIRVEFLNHYGETTVTVGGGATGTGDGPYDDVFDDGIYNPNTGDGSRPLILLALLGCFGGLALAVWSRSKRV